MRTNSTTADGEVESPTIVDQLSELGQTVAETAKSQASEVKSAVADKVETEVGRQKSAGAQYLGSIAQAVDKAAEGFEDASPQVAKYIRQAASQLDEVANTVREKDMSEIVGSVQDFAKRQPAIFFGGALMLGFAAARFIRSATPERHQTTTQANRSRRSA